MERVFLKCPTVGKPFDTGYEAARSHGLGTLSLNMAHCPYCDQHHYLRLPYFEGDPPGDPYEPADGLETAPAFAIEVGIIIVATSFMEVYIPQLYSKLTNAESSAALIKFGAMSSISLKIQEIEKLKNGLDGNPSGKDLEGTVEQLKECNKIRNKYAHAKYHYSGGSTITLLPYFVDTRKKMPSEQVSILQIRAEAERIRAIKYSIRDFISDGSLPAPLGRVSWLA